MINDPYSEYRDALGDEVDDIVRWQLTGILAKKAPVVRRPRVPLCQNCGGEWHGLPDKDCPGSHIFDTPEGVY